VTSDLKEQLARKAHKALLALKAPLAHKAQLVPKVQLGHREMWELRDLLAHREFKGPQDLRVILGHREQRALLVVSHLIMCTRFHSPRKYMTHSLAEYSVSTTPQ
jgi:hypothetical protein